MNNLLLILLCVFLFACASTDSGSSIPSPSECQAAGVVVDNDDTVTGVIYEELQGEQTWVMARCQSPFKKKDGCTRVHNITDDGYGVYTIFYVHDLARKHERCHALYEEWRHVIILEEF